MVNSYIGKIWFSFILKKPIHRLIFLLQPLTKSMFLPVFAPPLLRTFFGTFIMGDLNG